MFKEVVCGIHRSRVVVLYDGLFYAHIVGVDISVLYSFEYMFSDLA